MANYLDETGLQRVRDKIDSLYRRKGDLIGTVMWWSGSISSIPSNAKICNGQSLSSATYATLYERIGTTYGGDSTNFALPDLRTSSDYGRFVRARFKDIGSGSGQITLANITQEDAIRNITGTDRYGTWTNEAAYSPRGCFEYKDNTGYENHPISLENGTAQYFNANGDSRSFGNPMKDHAVATDNDGGIRPYNISMVPIIIVS